MLWKKRISHLTRNCLAIKHRSDMCLQVFWRPLQSEQPDLIWSQNRAEKGLLGGLPNCFSPIEAVKGMKITPNTGLIYVFRFFEGHCNPGNWASSGAKIQLKRACYEASQIVSPPFKQSKVWKSSQTQVLYMSFGFLKAVAIGATGSDLEQK